MKFNGGEAQLSEGGPAEYPPVFFWRASKKVLKYNKVFSNFFMRKYFELFRLGSQTCCKIRD